VSQSDGEEPSDDGTPEPAAGRWRILFITVATAAVAVAVGIGIYLLTSGDDSSDPVADEDRQTSEPLSPTSSPTTSESSAAPEETQAPSGDDVAAAQDVAAQAATAITNADIAAMTQLSCDPSTVGTEEQFPPDATAEVAGEPQISGDTATVELTLTIGDSEPTTVPMPLTKKDGRWCVP